MFRHLFAKDVHRILTTHTFAITIILLTVVLSIGFLTNASELLSELDQRTEQELMNTRMLSTQSDYLTAAAIGLHLQRQPHPLHIFEQGITNHLGRETGISSRKAVFLDSSENLENPIAALFRELDVSFAAITLLSLMALLTTYDAFCGERRRGTLKLMLAGRVPRYRIALSKLASAFTCMSFAFIVAFGISLFLLWVVYPQALNLLTPESSTRLALMVVSILVFLAVWVCIGTMISGLTAEPSASFIISFMVWVLLVHVLPHVSTAIADRINPSQSYSSSQSLAFKEIAEKREDHLKDISTRERWREAERSGRVATFLAEEARAELQLQQQVLERYLEEFKRQQNRRIALASAIARSTSPVASLEYALQRLSGSGWTRQAEYLEQLRNFKSTFLGDIFSKLDAIRPENPWEQWDLIYQAKQLDITRKDTGFRFREPGLNTVLSALLLEWSSLVLQVLVLVLSTVIVFNRYDVR